MGGGALETNIKATVLTRGRGIVMDDAPDVRPHLRFHRRQKRPDLLGIALGHGLHTTVRQVSDEAGHRKPPRHIAGRVPKPDPLNPTGKMDRSPNLPVAVHIAGHGQSRRCFIGDAAPTRFCQSADSTLTLRPLIWAEREMLISRTPCRQVADTLDSSAGDGSSNLRQKLPYRHSDRNRRTFSPE